MDPRQEVLIGAEAALLTPGLRFIDATWFLDSRKRGEEGFAHVHIPGAVFFDIDAICDKSSALPHMLPSEDVFARAVGALGLTETDAIVVYDQTGISSAPRAWWTFRFFGARSVRVLDGGLPAWLKAGGTAASGPTTPAPACFHPRAEPSLLAERGDIEAAIETGNVRILDARPSERFYGEAAEPRPGLRRGHMPGAASLPASHLVEDGRLLPPDRLLLELEAVGLDPDASVITTCGSGVAAATISLALASLGRPSSLYDGSWSEWGQDGNGTADTG